MAHKVKKHQLFKPKLDVYVESEADEEIKRRRKETGRKGGLKRKAKSS